MVLILVIREASVDSVDGAQISDISKAILSRLADHAKGHGEFKVFSHSDSGFTANVLQSKLDLYGNVDQGPKISLHELLEFHRGRQVIAVVNEAVLKEFNGRLGKPLPLGLLIFDGETLELNGQLMEEFALAFKPATSNKVKEASSRQLNEILDQFFIPMPSGEIDLRNPGNPNEFDRVDSAALLAEVRANIEILERLMNGQAS